MSRVAVKREATAQGQGRGQGKAGQGRAKASVDNVCACVYLPAWDNSSIMDNSTFES